jgi:NAD(P)-dependent dehydrogenase (short-subunit alcohol dehydrogenase family)
MSDDLGGKVFIVTGANSGLGLVSATEFARRGARVVMMCRSQERGAEAQRQIVEETGGDVDLILCDFSDMSQIRAAAEAFRETYDRLDVLLNNAGVYLPKRMVSPQGLEMTFAINHIGYFLMTHELLPLLLSTEASRVVSVTSAAHYYGSLDLDDLQFERRAFIGQRVYGTSKLLNVLFTVELARRLEGTGTTANCVHPGLIRSGFGKDEPGIMNGLMTLISPFIMSPKWGARGSIHLATSSEVAAVSGAYFSGKGRGLSTPGSRDPEMAKRLWAASETLCGLG